ncbi:MAG: polysaccharide biosynthesis C-terminal domain-containing protein [Gulosibacter sp.]|uniref:polysaccharide biosynthesis C-terminal domain-containing protein n=1 Tax=Gulosibacter sp. TaxID=2817531 RepID=UPI003F905570
MTKIALSGGNGFLGWHVRAALRERGIDSDQIAVGQGFELAEATATLDGAERFVHLAGVNRAEEDEVRDGNRHFAEQLARAIQHAASPPQTVVYANSIQAGNGTAYGDAKEAAARILARACAAAGCEFIDVHLPNLFGEHGRPFYNSVTATFAYLLAGRSEPTVEVDRELTLLHAQNAADLLLGTGELERQSELEEHETVVGLLHRLTDISTTYRSGEIPDLDSAFSRDLFNTYRSFVHPENTPTPITQHSDARGAFFEIVRAHGGTGQTSLSTTNPGITRGEHFHRRKVERFTVIEGEAIIRLRKLFSIDVHEYHVSGRTPVSIDMPTMWTHNITNVGDETLFTTFWTNDIFDPTSPDTIAEAV